MVDRGGECLRDTSATAWSVWRRDVEPRTQRGRPRMLDLRTMLYVLRGGVFDGFSRMTTHLSTAPMTSSGEVARGNCTMGLSGISA